MATYTGGPIAWMTRNNVAANLLMVVCIVGGLVMFTGIKQEVFPDFDLGTVTVSVAYPGAGPEEVEQGIVLALEEAVQGLEGLDKFVSVASEGMGQVQIEVLEGTDINRFSQDVQREVDRITTFPDDAESPRIVVDARMREVLSIAVFGPQDEFVLREAAEQMRDRFLERDDITQVSLEGVRDHEISVSIAEEELRRYGLTLEALGRRLAEVSVEMGGGRLETRGGEILLRMKDRKYTAASYRDVAILTHKDGSRLLLGDIARVEESFEDTDVRAFFNGYPAVMVNVYRVGEETPIAVSRATLAALKELRGTLPEGIDTDVVRDFSRVFEQRADLLLRNAGLGLIIVFGCLALFLEIRLAFWVSLGIPISFMGAFLLLPMTDFSINMVTLFAFIVTLGIVVDDAIVVGENVYSMRQRGLSFMDASVQGAREMAVPVTFSVLTNMVAFLPLAFVPGMIGKIFGTLPLVVIAVFMMSLIESLYILPAHLAHQREGTRGLLSRFRDFQMAFSQGLIRFINGFYGPVLARCLAHRYLVLAVSLAILMVTLGYVKSGRMGMELFPRIESDYAFCEAVIPYGSSRERASEIHDRLVRSARKLVAEHGGEDLSLGIFSRIRENAIQVRIYLTAPGIRPMGTTELVNRWRSDVGHIAGIETISFQADRGGPGSGKALTVELSHRDIETLEAAGRYLAEQLRDFPLVSDVDDGAARGKQQLDFSMLPEGERLGLTAREVARQVRSAFQGVEALRFQRGRNEVTVRVRLPEKERMRMEHLQDLVLRTPEGSEVLFRDVVRLEEGRAYTEIRRRSGRRILNVTGDVTPASRAVEVVQALQAEVLPDLHYRFPGLTAGFEGRQADMQESTQRLFQGLFLAMVAVYALLAVPFKSYFQPLIMMCCIPFGLVGAVMGHLIMGYSLSMMSLFGIVALCGVVVNGGLVMIDLANRLRRQGVESLPAIWQAGVSRFRPILLTTLTTFGGLAPMIFETSRQARFLIPMAISLGFGIVFASLITLVLVPSFYMILEDMAGFFRKGETETPFSKKGIPVIDPEKR
ncbi:efflux RND transporter permease subunit [Desulfobotulus sp. H1]|uniref:Efflux RND transporter permease subunit n=1 Tax=Desulfobotulus pelophilus TaxID=2823377 RepID=A0ABT3N5G2_9BACT|nr:efflux RND transporter permease subunit [Desulfobotulus pelophilus]MCW7752690.1 efflux RND transporter permease subunit [Desulfobotulus pelophilus]